jgi:hypothetical protein
MVLRPLVHQALPLRGICIFFLCLASLLREIRTRKSLLSGCICSVGVLPLYDRPPYVHSFFLEIMCASLFLY